MTRNSITGQVKALAMIVAIEGLIPDRRAGSAENKPAPPPTHAHIYQAAWLGKQQQQTTGPKVEEGLGIPPVEPAAGAPPDPGLDSGDTPSNPYGPGESTIANRFNPSETQSATSTAFAPDTRVPFSIQKNRFGPRR
jgi:hypothetical protein